MSARVSRWFLYVMLIAPGWYLASASGAADRAGLTAARIAVARAHADIRTLETELAARANLGQLERWSTEIHLLAAPRPEQFVSETWFSALDPYPAAARHT